MNHKFCLWRRETFPSLTTLWKVETKNYIFPSKRFMIYIAGKHLVDPSIREILRLIKNDAQHSLWHIWEAVWLLPKNVRVASINEFKSSRAGVPTCFNSWKFVTVSYSNLLLLWRTCIQKVTSQSLFTDSKSN